MTISGKVIRDGEELHEKFLEEVKGIKVERGKKNLQKGREKEFMREREKNRGKGIAGFGLLRQLSDD